MYPRLRTALLVAMLLLAGCAGGNLSIDDASTTTSNDATTVESTTQTTQPTAETLPPGVTKDGVSNASALISAHKSELEETGYSFEYRTETAVEDKSIVATQHGVVSAGFTSYRSETVAEYDVGKESRSVQRTVWANRSAVLSKSVTNGTTRYRELLKRSSRFGVNRSYFDAKMTKSMELGLLLSSNEFAVVTTERVDGRTMTTLRTADTSRSDNSTDVGATLLVDATGRVHEFEWTAQTNRGRETREFELTGTDPDSVERPDWTEQAVAAVTADVRSTTHASSVELVHDGGDVLPAGSEIRIEHDGETATLELETALEPRQSVYVSYPSDGGSPVLTRERPDGTTEVEGSYSVTISDPNGNVVHAFGFAVGSESSSGASESS